MSFKKKTVELFVEVSCVLATISKTHIIYVTKVLVNSL